MVNWDNILGLNARNAFIDGANPRKAIRLVNDKHAAKQALIAVGNPVVPTLYLIRDPFELRRFNFDVLPEAWVVKPNQSLQGKGVMLAVSRTEGGWRSGSGKLITPAAIFEHAREIIDGEHSPGSSDMALFEPLLRPHATLLGLAPVGLPDIRVICNGSQPELAMARLPTHETGGRANLHQGGLGAAINLKTGRIDAAYQKGQAVDTHPDTNHPLVGTQIPEWHTILDVSARCAEATGLTYLGVDVVIDQSLGVIILEVNARPGLEIQNITTAGLYNVIFDESTERN